MSVTIQYLGAAGTVTGSMYLLRSGDASLLVDCGLFQGDREWRERNWDAFPVDPRSVGAVLVTHAHIDHIGRLPKFVREGFRGPIYATGATRALAAILLRDSAMLQAEEAKWRAKEHRSRHANPVPLYSLDDVEQALSQFQTVGWSTWTEIQSSRQKKLGRARWVQAGHIIGAGSIEVEFGGKLITFSGDIGRYGVPILRDPEPVVAGDLLLIESTYGTRSHPAETASEQLAKVINETTGRGGVTLVPAFAVGRAQLLLFYLRELKEQGKIPDIPVVVDSPMSAHATKIYGQFPECYDQHFLEVFKTRQNPFLPTKTGFVGDREESKKLNRIDSPMVIISASGMLTGGRILHHLRSRVGDPRNTVLLVGHQPPGGRGAWMLSGASTMRLFHEDVAVRAKTVSVSGLSAHAGRDELLRWASAVKGRPGRVAVVHGEDEQRSAMVTSTNSANGWNSAAPQYLEEWTI